MAKTETPACDLTQYGITRAADLSSGRWAMKFMIEFRLKPGSKNKAAEAFEKRGPNRNPGVTLRQAWVASSADVVFVLAEGTDESHVAAAAQAWSEHGQSQSYRVIDVEQF